MDSVMPKFIQAFCVFPAAPSERVTSWSERADGQWNMVALESRLMSLKRLASLTIHVYINPHVQSSLFIPVAVR